MSDRSTERQAFLDRIRAAAEAGRAHQVDIEQSDGVVGYVGAGPDLCEALAHEVQAVGGTASVSTTTADICRELEQLVAQLRPERALCWQHPLLDQLGVPDLLAGKQVACDDYRTLSELDAPARRERILAADVGISSVDYAVAETGSLVVCAQPGQERAVSLVPPVHIAIVSESQIVPDLFDVFAKLVERGPHQLPSNLAFITGPSKTGDIELQLTTGVHGPGQWHVLVLREQVMSGLSPTRS